MRIPVSALVRARRAPKLAVVSDVVFIVVTLACFVLLALVAKAVEKL